jgi:hypothetical protein
MTVSGSPLRRGFGLVAVARAGGKLALVFFTAAEGWISGAAARGGLRTAPLVSHLCGQAARAMFVEQVPQRTHGKT